MFIIGFRSLLNIIFTFYNLKTLNIFIYSQHLYNVKIYKYKPKSVKYRFGGWISH